MAKNEEWKGHWPCYKQIFKLSIILVFYTPFHSQRGQKHSLLSGTSPYSTMKVNLQI